MGRADRHPEDKHTRTMDINKVVNSMRVQSGANDNWTHNIDVFSSLYARCLSLCLLRLVRRRTLNSSGRGARSISRRTCCATAHWPPRIIIKMIIICFSTSSLVPKQTRQFAWPTCCKIQPRALFALPRGQMNRIQAPGARLSPLFAQTVAASSPLPGTVFKVKYDDKGHAYTTLAHSAAKIDHLHQVGVDARADRRNSGQRELRGEQSRRIGTRQRRRCKSNFSPKCLAVRQN